ncbi:dolichyl-phosphate beta-glucosyltransferase [uncultured Dokdonia sp.]|uniref:dolichyl-phosphate beta-glucosyltransferase n=1 Tax=uncultured Dokdonia sp. TaxID=575653 RepID=UPI00261738D0|nr:dolichyl-phosphate beta-glucosyltransferase [uncultured Dokdonia sp.]
MKTGIIIPCYNEEKRLPVDAFIKFITTHESYHLCFVNDGSKDNTIEVLETIQKSAPTKVSIVDIKKNAGKAAAVRFGSRYLFNRKDIDYIGFIDADLSTDFDDFKSLTDTLHKNQELMLVYGSRGKGEGQIERNIFRSLFSKIVKSIVFFILGLPIEDTQCGAKVFRRNAIPVAYNNTFLTRWLFDVEIFLRLKKHFGSKEIMNKMYEQPLNRWVHVDDSKLGMKDAIQIPVKLLQIWVSYNVSPAFNIQENTPEIAPQVIVLQPENLPMAA